MMVYSNLPVRPVFGLRREIDRLFDDVFGRESASGHGWMPAVDIQETADAYSFAIDLPGIDPANVEVTADNGVLRITGERKSESSDTSDSRWHVVERVHGTFARTFQLPSTADESGINATFSRGVLTVRVPKVEVPQPKRIAIETA